MDSTETKSAGCPNVLAISQYWVDLSKEEAAAEALRPFFSFSTVLHAVGQDKGNLLDPVDVNRVLMALVERAEVILGIPDGSS